MGKYAILFFLALSLCTGLRAMTVFDFENASYSGWSTSPCGDKVVGSCPDCGLNKTLRIVEKSKGQPVRDGKYASWHQIINCASNSEIKYPSPLGYDEIWMGWSIYVPADFTMPPGKDGQGWYIIFSQFHDREHTWCGNQRGGPTVMAMSRDKKVGFSLRHWTDQNCASRKTWWLGTVEEMKGKWTDIVLNARFTADKSKGFIKLWYYPAGSRPGNPAIDYRGYTYHPKKNGGPVFKMGIYAGHGDRVGAGYRGVLYTDELRIAKASEGATFEKVAPGGTAYEGDGDTSRPPTGSVPPVQKPALTLPHAKISFGGSAPEGWIDGDLFAQGGELYTFISEALVEGVTDPAPAAVYQSVYHRGTSTEPILIDFPDVPDGSYRLRLHVTDRHGGRAIDISAEEKPIVQDLDPMTESGGEMLPVIKEATVTVSDGNGLQMKLDDDRPVPHDVFLSGLEIIQSGVSTPVFHRAPLRGALKRHIPGGYSLTGRAVRRDRAAASIGMVIRREGNGTQCRMVAVDHRQ